MLGFQSEKTTGLKNKTKDKFESKDIKTYPLYQLNLRSDQHLISPHNNTAGSQSLLIELFMLKKKFFFIILFDRPRISHHKCAV